MRSSFKGEPTIAQLYALHLLLSEHSSLHFAAVSVFICAIALY